MSADKQRSLKISDEILDYTNQFDDQTEKIQNFVTELRNLLYDFNEYRGQASIEIYNYRTDKLYQLQRLQMYYSVLATNLKTMVVHFMHNDNVGKDIINKYVGGLLGIEDTSGFNVVLDDSGTIVDYEFMNDDGTWTSASSVVEGE